MVVEPDLQHLFHVARCGCVFHRLPMVDGTLERSWNPCCQHTVAAAIGTFPVGWPPRFTTDPQPVAA